MSSEICERGSVIVTRCCSRCMVCGQVKPGFQFTSDTGYVFLCDGDMAEILTECAAFVRDEGK